MNYTAKNLIRLLEQRGWELDRVRGSHYMFTHPDGGFIVVPMHGNRDIAKGTFYSILKEANIDKSDI